MSLVKASLVALVLLALPQAGGVDDLAELFAEDSMVFAEVTGVSSLMRDWKDYAGAYMPAAKKKELLDQMEKGAREDLEKVPELLRKDLEKALPTIQRAAVGLRMGSDGPEWAVAAASSDPSLFKKIVDEDLKVFSSEEKAHGGVTVRLIRKLGDVPLLTDGVWFAAAGRRLIATSQWSVMTTMLDRAANRAAGTDLRVNPNYRAFAATAGADPSFRAFSSFGSLMDVGLGFGGGRRSGAHQMDKINAVLGLDKIGGFLVEASLKPGKIASVARLRIGSPCPLYEAWRQPAGPKETLKYLPADAAVTAHVNVKSGKAVWAEILKLTDRWDEVEAIASATPNAPRPPRGTREMSERSFEREFGCKPDELFGAIGDEAAFGLVGPDAFAFDPRMVNALLFVVKVADPATALGTLKKLSAKFGAYEAKTADGATFLLPAGEKTDLPRFALKDGVCLIGGSKEAIDAGLAAAKSGKHFAAGLPPEAAKASKLIAADLGAFWKGLVPKIGAELPAEAKGLEFEARSLVMFEEKENEVVLRSSDGGTGLALQAVWIAMPLSLVVMTGRMGMAMADLEEVAPEAAAPAPFDGPPLPANELAAKVKALVADLQADDVDKREEAAGRLRALGKQAVPAVVAAYKAAADAETRGRLLSLLMDWKAYDAMPEVLAKKVDAFLQGFRRAPNPNDQRALMMMNMGVQWYRHEGMPWTYCMEPSWVNEAALKATPHVEVLRFAAGAKAAAEAAAAENVPVEPRRRLASILAYVDSGAAGEALIAARDAARDPEIKSYLQIAMGWSSEPKCRAAVRDGLKDTDVWMRRSSFIAAERSKDPAAVGRLLDLLKDADGETRWNAAYTLKSVSNRKATVNIFAPKADVDAATESAAAWWAKNKDTFTPGK